MVRIVFGNIWKIYKTRVGMIWNTQLGCLDLGQKQTIEIRANQARAKNIPNETKLTVNVDTKESIWKDVYLCWDWIHSQLLKWDFFRCQLS